MDRPGWDDDYGWDVEHETGDRRREEAVNRTGGPIPNWSSDYGIFVSTAEGNRRRAYALGEWRKHHKE